MSSTASFHGTNHSLQIGSNHGEINNRIILYPERPETSPEPLSTVPFQRDVDFVQRGDLIDRIDQKCLNKIWKLALVGLGGVGKSQLAVEYAYRIREKYPETWVFWVHASNASRFEQSYQEIADIVKIPDRNDPNAKRMNLIETWFKDPSRKWIVILDNVDDDQYLFESRHSKQCQDLAETQRPLVSFLPKSSNGSIIMTTRTQSVALRFVHENDAIHVEPMTALHASFLLEKKLSDGIKECTEKEDILKLVEALEFLPLAIVQAAAYINHRAPFCSVSKYLEDFQKSDSRRVKLLQHEAGQLYRDIEAKNSILLTWQLSFDNIRKKHPSAANLLSLLSFFDKNGIPTNILRISQSTSIDHDEDSSSDSDDSSRDSNNLQESLLILRDYSLVSINTDTLTCGMHRLVQLATRKWLEAHERAEEWRCHFIECVSNAFPRDLRDSKNWPVCQSLFPHVQAALSQQPASDKHLRKWASLLWSAAQYAEQKSDFAVMLNIATVSMKACKKRFGPLDDQAITHIWLAAEAHRSFGNYEEAENILEKIIEDCKETLGPEHIFTLRSINRLTILYGVQQKFTEAIEIDKWLVDAYKKIFGVENSQTLIVMHNLALRYNSNGQCLEAIEISSQVVNISKRTLGPDHSHTLLYIDNLAKACQGAGRWEDARVLTEHVFEMNQKTFGPETPQMLDSMERLAESYILCRRLSQAEPLVEQALQGRKKVFGSENPRTIHAMEIMASLWKKQGRHGDAISLQKQCIHLLKQVLGEKSRWTLKSSETMKSWLEDEIVDAAESGRLSDIERYACEGANLNHHDFFWGRSPISQAAQSGQTHVLSFLLQKGVSPDSLDVCGSNPMQNNAGKTPLMWAAIFSQSGSCRILLDHGADTKLEERDGRTALSWASEHGHQGVVEALLKADAPVNHKDRYRQQTPLSWAAMHGHESIVELLLRNGADPTLADQANQRPASWAAQNGHEAVANLLEQWERKFEVDVS